MPLAALILAESEDLDGPTRALLPVAGQTLLEYQARLAWNAGARHIVAMVDHVQPAMVAAFDRLRDEDIAVQIARNASDAADRIHPEEQLLVIAAGAFAPPAMVSELVSTGDCRLLTLADSKAAFERIDGTDHWAGFAVLDGRDLRSVAPMLGEWDLGSTLIRAGVQRGCGRHRAEPETGVRRLHSHADAAAASESLATGGSLAVAAPFSRFVVRPLAQQAATRAMAAGVPFEMASVVAPAILATAVTLGALGWLATAFTLLTVALIIGEASARIASAAMRRSGLVDWLPHLEIGAAIGLLFAAARTASEAGLGWGVFALAAWASVNLVENRARLRAWLGELAIVMGLAFVANQPVAGMGAVLVAQLALRWWRPRQPVARAAEPTTARDVPAY